jgi:MFS transporter, DHA2 family, multidrug resistance protein
MDMQAQSDRAASRQSRLSHETRIWIGFGAMCFGMFMAILDIQVVASSLNNIQYALHVPADQLSWIQTAYLMAEVVAIPLTGWLTHTLSLRWMFSAATFGFTLASLGCASVSSIEPLIAIRVIQGFCGGMLIPSVFTSIFAMVPTKHRVLATTIAGTLAVLAPTIGPAVGGYLTVTLSWHWIFLINILPGIVVSALVVAFVSLGEPDLRLLRRIDHASIVLGAVFLGTLELLLKEAPKRNWQGTYVYVVGTICAVSALLALWRCLRAQWPFVHLRLFRQLSFALGCVLSLIFGMGLYGSVYLISIFLGAVRGHTPLEIGVIMIVSGAAQLLTAPIAAVIEPRMDPRILTAIGFGLFGAGLLTNGFESINTDFAGLFLPQVLRGVAVMLCILPATRLALASCPEDEVADASALFNLMRNLGGAIGIALIDTILEQRTEGHFWNLVHRLQAGDPTAARIVGLPTHLFHNRAMGPVDPVMREMIEPLIRKAALVLSFNDAWLVVGGLFALSLLALPFIDRVPIGEPAFELLARQSPVETS